MAKNDTAEAFSGIIELDNIVTFASKTLGVNLKGKSAAPPPPPKPAAPLVLQHVQTQDELFKHCFDKNGLCVLTWLPDDDLADKSGPNGSNKYVNRLKEVTAKMSAMSLVYMNANQQSHFIEALGGNPGAYVLRVFCCVAFGSGLS
jgi:hypothetical protein